ncbi:hypothetical protein ULG90_21690 [Halopseudomonas pachastrellae]|nr:hypothetical protein ULG90_21690 [Halopseudomonas pachastrellae]
MLKSTEERYRKLARNFYKTRMPGTQLSTSAICEALTGCAADYRPGYFRVLKNALSFDVRERGYPEAAKRIVLTPNPTTLPGSTIPPKEKLHAVKALSEDDIAALLHHLGKTALRRFCCRYASLAARRPTL